MSNRPQKSVLFIVPYPEKIAPGQRFRFELFLTSLNNAGISNQTKPFIAKRAYGILFRKGHFFPKLIAVFSGFLRRIVHLGTALKYDFIYIYREATPVGPPWWEWAARLTGKKIIYDFDDAIWMRDDNEKKFPGALKWKQKVPSICNWSYKISVGNAYLSSYAEQFNPNVQIIPTVVDTNYHIPQKSIGTILTIGWTGSHSTLPYLEMIMPLLRKLRRLHEFRFLIIADQDPGYTDKFIEFKKWSIETEIADLNEIDIGIMPLPDSPWANGKCGFKLIQYLSLQIPAIASDVGVNKKIIGNAGFICENELQWEEALITLITNSALREKMGLKGRQHVLENYSVKAVEKKFLELFT